MQLYHGVLSLDFSLWYNLMVFLDEENVETRVDCT